MEEEKEKICPILSIEGDSLEPCIEEYCAWYNKETEMCAILDIADTLIHLLKRIRNDH